MVGGFNKTPYFEIRKTVLQITILSKSKYLVTICLPGKWRLPHYYASAVAAFIAEMKTLCC